MSLMLVKALMLNYFQSPACSRDAAGNVVYRLSQLFSYLCLSLVVSYFQVFLVFLLLLILKGQTIMQIF